MVRNAQQECGGFHGNIADGRRISVPRNGLPVKLPGADHSICDAAKVRDYLLSLEHPVGRSKARFFQSLGFTRLEWLLLQSALLQLGREGEAELGASSVFGQKYLVRGSIQGPSGEAAVVVTVWIILTGETTPRLITAHPGSLR